jgi:DNA repair photolyase
MAIPPRKARGSLSNPGCRFDRLQCEAVDDGWDLDAEEAPAPRTEVLEDRSRSAITRNDSPDVPFDQSLNPYRGCEHGCIYCFARPSHAYLGLSPGLDFETTILAKPQAPALLRRELCRPGYRCRVIAFGTNTDPYQPVERRLRIMRGCLEVLAEARHPVSITTKGALVTRDIDLLAPMAAERLAAVGVSVTTLDRDLCRKLEPRAAVPDQRLEAIRRLAAAGIPTTVMVAPVIPAITDHELERILTAARQAGATSAAYILLRLPLEVESLVTEWLQTHAPAKADHVLSLMRQSRGGKLYSCRFNDRRTGTGVHAEMLAQRFRLAARRLGFDERGWDFDTSAFTPPNGQMRLF